MIGLPFGLLNSGGVGTPNAKCASFPVFHSSAITSIAGFRLLRAGDIESNTGGVFATITSYVSSGQTAVIGDEYEVFVTQITGPALTGANSGLGVWLSLNVARQWAYEDAGGAFRMGTFDYQVREIADPGNISLVCTATLETEDNS